MRGDCTEADDDENLAAATWRRRLLRGHAVSDHSGLRLCERNRAVPFQLQRSDFFRNPGLVVFWQCSRWNGNDCLSIQKRAQIIAALVEGNSIRATVRMTGASKNTIAKLLVELGGSVANLRNGFVRLGHS